MTLWLLGALGLLVGIGGGEVRRVERLAAADLEERITLREGGRVEVRAEVDPLGALFGDVRRATIRASGFSSEGLPFFTEPNRPKSGRLGELRLELREFDLSGLRVELLEARITRCRFDLGLARREGRIRLSESGSGTGYVRVREADLEAFALAKHRELRSVRIRVERDKVFVEGEGEFLVLRTSFEMIANLLPVDGTKLVLADARIWLAGRRAEGPAAESLLRILNPILDLDQDLHLHGAMQVERLRLRDGVIEGFGTARIPVAPGLGGQ